MKKEGGQNAFAFCHTLFAACRNLISVHDYSLMEAKMSFIFLKTFTACLKSCF